MATEKRTVRGRGDDVRAHVDVVAGMLAGQFPAVAELLLDAKADLTAFANFPHAHWQKIWSTNPLERLNREVNDAPKSSGSSQH
jgi:putative transposase